MRRQRCPILYLPIISSEAGLDYSEGYCTCPGLLVGKMKLYCSIQSRGNKFTRYPLAARLCILLSEYWE